ncbi:unnamed protein product [Nippostrongylus brasiliensis]|uniref:Velvet domain-containing protein n=1 Tax=Nippostrongylus brasiliensis TaxID=27835 RepID=A0A0N4Y3B5_NIPBR|nr:unnamed protein product [Nippostrongylus brasiliensis]
MSIENPWKKRRAGVPSAVETLVNMDAIILCEHRRGNTIEFYSIFSITHRLCMRCGADIDLPVGVWMRLQYTGDDFDQGFLSGRRLRLIKTIPAPRNVPTRLERYDGDDLRVILTTRVFVEYLPNERFCLVSDDLGDIRFEREQLPSVLDQFEEGVDAEVEFYADSLWLRRLFGLQKRDHSYPKATSREFRNNFPSTSSAVGQGFPVVTSDMLHSTVKSMRRLSLSSDRQSPSQELPRDERIPSPIAGKSAPSKISERKPSDSSTAANPRAESREVPKWLPPKILPTYENVIDTSTEKPSGRDPTPAWCCVVRIRVDHIICYAPIAGIHKILVTAELLKQCLGVSHTSDMVDVGLWLNVMCEPRCNREYDDVRQPHFSHIATKICAAPQRNPPVEPWNQRVVCGHGTSKPP